MLNVRAADRLTLSHQAAAELSGKFFCDCSTGKTPQREIAIICVSVPDVRHLDTALIVKLVHQIGSFPKAAQRYGNFHDERKVASDGLGAGSAFIATGHQLTSTAPRCPLLAQSGHELARRTCPLLGVKRT